MISELIQKLENWSDTAGSSPFQKLSITIPRIDASQWLAEQDRNLAQVYWYGRDEQISHAYLGSIWEWTPQLPLSSIETILRASVAETRIIALFPFLPEKWTEARIFFPEIELVSTPNQSQLSVYFEVKNNKIQNLSRLYAHLKNLQWHLPHQSVQPQVNESPHYLPTRSEWHELVSKALSKFEPSFSKIVLARKTELTLSNPIRPTDLLQCLDLSTGQHYQIWTSFPNTPYFFSRSPEQLFKIENNTLTTEAIAGTRDKWDGQFLSNPKEIHEHEIVVQDIEERLQEIKIQKISKHTTKVVSVSNLFHLKTEFTAMLPPDTQWHHILNALHPTAAVGGYPRHTALNQIREWEPFDRGYYAGSIGWIGLDHAEFAVGIRSGTIEKNTLALYSGTGLVNGSEADKEWTELNAKIAEWINILQ